MKIIGIGINIALTGVIHDGTRFVAVGYNYDFGISSWVGGIYTSTDGSAWTRRHQGGEELRDIAYSSGRYIATLLDNEEKVRDFGHNSTPVDYSPQNLRTSGVR